MTPVWCIYRSRRDRDGLSRVRSCGSRPHQPRLLRAFDRLGDNPAEIVNEAGMPLRQNLSAAVVTSERPDTRRRRPHAQHLRKLGIIFRRQLRDHADQLRALAG